MMTFKLMLGAVLLALYLLAWVMVILLGLELAPRRSRASVSENADDVHNGLDSERPIAPIPVSVNDWGEEGARPSSLLPYYHHKPDQAYLLQLKHAVEKANEEAVRMYGPLPAGGLPVQNKTKPNVPYRDFLGNLVPEVPSISEENEMKLREIAVAAALAVGATACNSATPEVNADKAIHAHSADVTSVSSAPSATSSTTDAQDEPKPTNGPLGQEYKTIDSFAEFRKKLLADGWKPVANPKCHEAVLGADYDKTCKKDPGDVYCSVCDKIPEIVSDVGGVGYVDGYNLMHYTKNGMPLSVTVYGDLRGVENPKVYDLVVVGWEFALSHDAIPLDEHVPRDGK